MNKFDISIIIVSYNQEDKILMCLESIKYQVKHYRSDYTIQLIVSDDGSKDKTAEYIRKWISINGDLFDDIVPLLSESNRGTCKNASAAYGNIKGNHVITIAGDDMIINTDVFAQIMSVEPNELVGCPAIHFMDDHFISSPLSYYYRIIKEIKYCDVKGLYFKSKYHCPILNGAMVGRDFFGEEAIKFSEEYHLLDDWTRFIKAFEIIDTVKYRYSNKPILLYRISNTQVTNKSNPLNKILIEDKIKLLEYLIRGEKNPFYRYRCWLELLNAKRPALYNRVFKFFNFWTYLNCFRNLKRKSDVETEAKKIVKYAEDNKVDAYIAEIMRQSAQYL